MISIRLRWSIYSRSVNSISKPVQVHTRASHHFRHISSQTITSHNLPSTCSCTSTPAGLAIDREKSLDKTVPPYSRHIIIYTGKPDWTSKIDDDPSVKPIIKKIRERCLGLPGRTLITASSTSIESRWNHKDTKDCLYGLRIFPDGDEYTWYKENPAGLDALFEQLQDQANNFDTEIPAFLDRERQESDNGLHWDSSPYPTILICSHKSRDSRCGVLGPLLHAEFTKQHASRSKSMKTPTYADIDMISHIGGHVFAGNIIIYFPTSHPLAGCGLWYGRVEPRHVEGILEETVRKGIIIKDLFRGGITQDGRPLSLSDEMGVSGTE